MFEALIDEVALSASFFLFFRQLTAILPAVSCYSFSISSAVQVIGFMHYGTLVIPVCNSGVELGPSLCSALSALQKLRLQGWKLVVVRSSGWDSAGGDSMDALGADALIEALPGVANMMNAGARLAEGEVIVFLPVDVRLPDTFVADMAIFVATETAWGRFDLQFLPATRALYFVSRWINELSRLQSVAERDQVLFFRQEFFLRLGGFPLIPLLEDWVLTRKARAQSLPFCPKARVTVPAERWTIPGIGRKWLSGVLLRLGYRCRVAPGTLNLWRRKLERDARID